MTSYFNLTLDTTAPSGVSLSINSGQVIKGDIGIHSSIRPFLYANEEV